MLGVMRDAVNVEGVFGRLRRQEHSGVVDTDTTPHVQIVTPPDDVFSKQRSCKSHIPFFSLDVSYRKDFYGRDAHYYIENESGVTTYIFSAEQVEPYVRRFGLAVVTAYAATGSFSSKRYWFCLC